MIEAGTTKSESILTGNLTCFTTSTISTEKTKLNDKKTNPDSVNRENGINKTATLASITVDVNVRSPWNLGPNCESLSVYSP